MNELSVNISGAERRQIINKAIDLFLKTAKARHPDENFYKNLTKRIYENALNECTTYVDHPLYAQIGFVNTVSLTSYLARLQLPDGMDVLNLCNTDNNTYKKMLISNTYLSPIDIDDLVIPDTHRKGIKVLFPFKYFGEYSLKISQELKDEINEHNKKMIEVYGDLGTQLNALINVIHQCKTTKAFYSKLPNLTTLFPNSVHKKISRKNDVKDVELTEEEKLMQDATNSIATANLLGD